ncbi:hypothetical protein D9619_011543 [Psilocybe cf. subviscida]|uniref:Copper transporter n=1 Tax=Psilocybe cf. subviscida TaxID=2480587 RepID=A0A8H5F9L2_9AGAR|nr:hypothetical protein D9619_011543 [Psilocybe cf. subviscida]
MKLSALGALVLGAGIVQVAAVPIRVILVSTSIQEGGAPLDHVRFGHAVPYLKPDVAQMMAPGEGGRHHVHRPCKGRMGAVRQKSIEISNQFRKALGWPLIEPHHHMHHPHHAQPMKTTIEGWHPHPDRRPRPSRPYFQLVSGQGNFRGDGFTSRLMYSLANLGRWEGRAVAFVLGCGIGVLLRMFYVLFIVAYRAVRGPREDEHEYSHVIMFEAADVADAPPSYASPADEKLALDSHNKIVDSVKPCHR